MPGGPGTLYIVATPIGNLQDISHRAVAVLGSVDLIAAEDTRTTKVLLDHYGISRPLISHHSYNEHRRIRDLIDRLISGASIAVVSDAGTPGISDPAFALVREAVAAGVTVVPVPGATAFVPALVASGIPCDRFAFEGFLPVKKGRKTRLESLAKEERTIVLYESPHRIQRTLRDLLAALGDRPAVLAREITKKFEEFDRGPLAQLAQKYEGKEGRGEFVIVLAGRRWSDQPEAGEED